MDMLEVGVGSPDVSQTPADVAVDALVVLVNAILIALAYLRMERRSAAVMTCGTCRRNLNHCVLAELTAGGSAGVLAGLRALAFFEDFFIFQVSGQCGQLYGGGCMVVVVWWTEYSFTVDGDGLQFIVDSFQ